MKKLLFAAALATSALMAGGVATAGAAPSTPVVKPSDVATQAENTPPTKTWVFYYRTLASTGTFRSGPVTPPLGVGSFELSTPTGDDKGTLFNFEHNGTKLSDVDDIAYSTYR